MVDPVNPNEFLHEKVLNAMKFRRREMLTPREFVVKQHLKDCESPALKMYGLGKRLDQYVSYRGKLFRSGYFAGEIVVRREKCEAFQAASASTSSKYRMISALVASFSGSVHSNG